MQRVIYTCFLSLSFLSLVQKGSNYRDIKCAKPAHELFQLSLRLVELLVGIEIELIKYRLI